jgi:hypothetical protein
VCAEHSPRVNSRLPIFSFPASVNWRRLIFPLGDSFQLVSLGSHTLFTTRSPATPLIERSLGIDASNVYVRRAIGGSGKNMPRVS